MGKKYLYLLGLLSSILFSCAYQVAPTVSPAVNIYSSYEDKIADRWALVIDKGTTIFTRDIKPSSYACSAHHYPFNSGDTISASIKRTLDNVFQEIIERNTTPSYNEMRKDNLKGVVIIRLDDFTPRVQCDQGFWSTKCIATIDISFGLEVRGSKGTLYGSSVGEQSSSDGDAGGACGNVSNIIAEAYRLALRESLEKMAEKISNSERIRKYASDQT